MVIKKRSTNRISSIFSLSSLSSTKSLDDAKSDAPSVSSERLSPLPAYNVNKGLGSARFSKSQPHLVPPVEDSATSSQQPSPSTLSSPATPQQPFPDIPEIALPPPPVITDDGVRPRSVSADGPRSRSSSRVSLKSLTPSLDTNSDGPNKLKRRTWLPGLGKANHKKKGSEGPRAWIIGHEGKEPYNVDPLLQGQKVEELWNDSGDTYVYLFPRISEKGASFKVDSSIFAASPPLTRLAFGRLYSEVGIAVDEPRVHPGDSPALESSPDGFQSPIDLESSDSSKGSRAMSDPSETPSEIHLYLPIKLNSDVSPTPSEKEISEDTETLLGIRNFIAFLIGQSLVATPQKPDFFAIFMRIADILRDYEFSNFDGSTFGEVAATSFDGYVEELGLGDVRKSTEKTIEGVVLGERMRSVMLYNECFVHGVGKWDELKALKSPKFQLISELTRKRMERASMDLYLRVKNIEEKFDSFDFPAIFSGIMDSKTAEERKHVRFDRWKSAFFDSRKFCMHYYKDKYGSWPPKANSKKNNLETSGLNRLVLQDMYNDFSSLYDLLVDRTSLTTRTVDGPAPDEEGEESNIRARALRRVLSEYDRSTPPVQPPVPFDVPLLPTLESSRDKYPSGDAKKDAKARKKTLKDPEIATILAASHNEDANISTPFLDAYRAFEKKSCHRSNIEDICDFRDGLWIFMYAILQSLPMLVVDAPGIKWTRGVEYFLCEPPRGGVPWAREDPALQRSWYGVAGSTQVVSLPSDIIEYGVEGIYRRSHCWQQAEKWTAGSAIMQSAALETTLPPPPELAPPGAPGSPRVGYRSHSGSLSVPGSGPDSPSWSDRRKSVMDLGLEALPLPAGVAPPSLLQPARPPTANDPTKTFDAILAQTDAPAQKKKHHNKG